MSKILFLILFATFNFQTYEKKYATVTVDNLYSIDVPRFLQKTDSLHSTAQFQYKNIHKNIYIFILHIPLKQNKQVDLNVAHEFGMKEIKNKVKYFHSISEVKAIKLQNTEGLQSSFYFGKSHPELNLVGVYSQFTTIKGKTHLYKIHIWTWAKKIRKHQRMMKQIVESFRELE